MRLNQKQKRIVTLLAILFLVPAIGIGVWLLLQDQDTRTDASAAEGKIVLSPAEIDKEIGSEFSVTILPNPDPSNGGAAMAVDVLLNFDPAKLEVVSVEEGPSPGTYPYQGRSNQIDNVLGIVRVSWLAYDSEDKVVLSPIISAVPIGEVNFRVKAEGGTDIEVSFEGNENRFDSNIIQKTDDEVIDIIAESSIVEVNGGGSIPETTGGSDTNSDSGTGNDDGSSTGNDSGTDGGSDDGGSSGGNDDGGGVAIPEDINNDGEINLADYSIFVQDYVACKQSNNCNSRSDLNQDDLVNLQDYVIFLEAYLEAR